MKNANYACTYIYMHLISCIINVYKRILLWLPAQSCSISVVILHVPVCINSGVLMWYLSELGWLYEHLQHLEVHD